MSDTKRGEERSKERIISRCFTCVHYWYV